LPDRTRPPAVSISSADPTRRRERFDRVVLECIESEKAYHNSLNLLLNVYLRPLTTGKIKQTLGLSQSDIEALFSNLESLVAFHQVMLMDMETEADISHVLLKNAPFLKLYTQYVASYDRILQTMTRLSKSTTFQEYLHTKQKMKEVKGLDIMSFFIMPVQRVPRYELLLRELIRYSDSSADSPEYASLRKALDQIIAINTSINEHKRQAENMSELLRIAGHIYGLPKDVVLISPSRRFVRSGDLTVKTRSLFGANKPVKCLLFNDLFVWTNDRWKFKGFFELER